MKKIKIGIVAISLFFGINYAQAQDATAEVNKLKIAYVSVETVLYKWNKVATLMSEMKVYQQQLLKEVDALQQEYNTKAAEFQRDAPTLNETEQQARIIDIKSLGDRIQLYSSNIEPKVNQRTNEKLQPLFGEISVIVNEIAKEKNYSHVFNQTSNGNSILLYARDESGNLTVDVMKKLGIELSEEELNQLQQK